MSHSKKNTSDRQEVTHGNWQHHQYEEEFKFSANGKYAYIKRIFSHDQILYWVADSDCYPLDQGRPSNARAYSAVNRKAQPK